MMKRTISLALLCTVMNVACGSKKSHDDAPVTVTPGPGLLKPTPSERADTTASLVSDLRKELDIIPRSSKGQKSLVAAAKRGALASKLGADGGKSDGDKSGDEDSIVFGIAGDHDCEKDFLPEFEEIFDALEDGYVKPIQQIIKETDKTKLQKTVTDFLQNGINSVNVDEDANDDEDQDDEDQDDEVTSSPEDEQDLFGDSKLFDVSVELASEKNPAKVVFTPKKGEGSGFLPTATFEAGNDKDGIYSKAEFKQHIDFGDSPINLPTKDGEDKLETPQYSSPSLDTNFAIDFKADLTNKVIKNSIAFDLKASEPKGETTNEISDKSKFSYEIGAGQGKPYIFKEMSSVVKQSSDDEETTNLDFYASVKIEKIKANQLAVTFTTKEDGTLHTFVGTLNINADKTCKFKVDSTDKK